jgi:hypothetical protein
VLIDIAGGKTDESTMANRYPGVEPAMAGQPSLFNQLSARFAVARHADGHGSLFIGTGVIGMECRENPG